MAQTLESWDPRLSAALAALALDPSADQHRAVAIEYRRLGVLDMAHHHFTEATRLDPGDAAAHDGLARIWRDWGVPQLGLADAYKAVRLAPDSPVTANTLGTLLEATGQTELARQWYARALTFDGSAGYAMNNLCYASIMLRDSTAITACERAQGIAPGSTVARNNLGLAYAASGDFERAREVFFRGASDENRQGSDAGDDVPRALNNDGHRARAEAGAHYNMGILYMARRQYRDAEKEFASALGADPTLPLAAVRARQARMKEAEAQAGQPSATSPEP